MPPMQLKIVCLECRYKTTGYMARTLKNADKHAEKEGHQLVALRRSDNSRFCVINPPQNIEFRM